MGGVGFSSVDDQVTCCYVDSGNRACRHTTIRIPRWTHEAASRAAEHGEWPMEFEALDKFLASLPETRQFTIGTDTYFIKKESESHVAPLLFFLGVTGRAVPIFTVAGDQDTMLLPPAMAQLKIMYIMKDRPPTIREPRYLYEADSAALSFVIFDGCSNPLGRAAAAALVAENDPLHYLLCSGGTPQSSQDIIAHINTPRRMFKEMFVGNTGQPPPNFVSTVVAATETFSLEGHEPLNGKDPRTIALEYELARNSCKGASELQALKFAVLAVCRKWGIRFSCQSLLDEFFLSQVMAELAKVEKLAEAPKLILQVLESPEPAEVGMADRLRQLFANLSGQGVDISNLTLQILHAASIHSRAADSVILDGTADQYAWLRCQLA